MNSDRFGHQVYPVKGSNFCYRLSLFPAFSNERQLDGLTKGERYYLLNVLVETSFARWRINVHVIGETRPSVDSRILAS